MTSIPASALEAILLGLFAANTVRSAADCSEAYAAQEPSPHHEHRCKPPTMQALPVDKYGQHRPRHSQLGPARRAHVDARASQAVDREKPIITKALTRTTQPQLGQAFPGL